MGLFLVRFKLATNHLLIGKFFNLFVQGFEDVLLVPLGQSEGIPIIGILGNLGTESIRSFQKRGVGAAGLIGDFGEASFGKFAALLDLLPQFDNALFHVTVRMRPFFGIGGPV